MKRKVAVIGLGKQAEKYHLSGLLTTESATLVAVCDIDKARVDSVSETFGVKGYTSVKELLEKETLDFIIIATPHDTHSEIVRLAAERGVHVLKEKPFAKNLQEAIELAEIAKNGNIELMVTLQRRFNTIYAKFFDYIQFIGKPSFIDIKYNIFADDPHPSWRGKREKAGGGCILDMGYHMIDLLIWYFGLPSSVYSNFSTVAKDELDFEVEDSASVIFDYGKDCTGNMNLSRFSIPKTEYVKIIGHKGVLEILKDRINVYGANGELVECVIAANPTDTQYVSKQIDYFCAVLDKEKENISSPISNLSHMLFVEACYRSKAEKKIMDPKSLFLPLISARRIRL